MIIGIPTDDGRSVSEHFGRSRYFMIVDKEHGEETKHVLVENPHDKEENEQSGHGKLLKMLVESGANKVVCFNLNPRMQKNLESFKIEVERTGSGKRVSDFY